MRENEMARQALELPDFLRAQVKKQKEAVRFLLSTPEIFGVKQVLLTGCGDSLMAASAAQSVWGSLTGLPVRALSAMEASRYLAPAGLPMPPKATLALGISSSGETARTVEALSRLKEAGAVTVAAVCRADSRMGRGADKALLLDRPDGGAPGAGGFLGALLALLLLAARMAEVRGTLTMDAAEGLRREMAGCAGAAQTALKERGEELGAFARLCAEFGEVELLGCGPGLGAAQLGAAKVLEATGMRASCRETEEFCHLSFFRRQPHAIPTVLLRAENGNAKSREDEVERMLRVLGRPLLILDSCGVREAFAPLVWPVLVTYLASQLPDLSEADYFRGHAGVWSGVGYPETRESVVERLEATKLL